MNRMTLGLGGALLVLSTLAATRSGGWAIVSVEDPPDYFLVGQPTELSFVVRQHGMQRMLDVRPRVEAKSGSQRINVTQFTLDRGVYRVPLVLPAAGDWQITIHSGWGGSKGKLLPIRALKAGEPVPPRKEGVARGRTLFAAKGCVTCHVRGDVDIEGEMQGSAPELTGRTFPADYLARFLANPSIKPPTNRNFQMPNPELKQTEIAALVAYLNSAQAVSVR
jgi:mono/diheme cytochrome c family protein